jgi:malate synthase
MHSSVIVSTTKHSEQKISNGTPPYHNLRWNCQQAAFAISLDFLKQRKNSYQRIFAFEAGKSGLKFVSIDCTMETIAETLIGVEVKAPVHPSFNRILSPEALQFLGRLHRKFNKRREQLLKQRELRQADIDNGMLPDFLPSTEAIRNSEWKVGPIPECLQDRRVEITGPVDRKMIINALNSGAKVFMADFEDSTSPTWENIIEGQLNLYDAIRREIDFELADGKKYALNEEVSVLKVRPRGWHLPEKHILVDGEPISASLADFGLFIFHNGRHLASEGKGPFFYLPKMESHLEARLWNDVFVHAQEELLIPNGTIKATVLIETILAAFEMDEIIYELRDHLAGLNAGRWDYIFSIIKKLRHHANFILPDRSLVTMTVPFMKAYAELLVKTCHHRGAHAIGGMSAFIPSKDEAVNAKAFEQVQSDKVREASQGYDGTWVAHPKLVAVAQKAFDQKLGRSAHQKNEMRQDLSVSAKDILSVSAVPQVITEKGVRTNINVALLYIESWLRGVGAAALYNLMEDAATAEISRAQLWQWLHNQVSLEDGRTLDKALYQAFAKDEYEKVKKQLSGTTGDVKRIEQAYQILNDMVLDQKFENFLTTKAYVHLG